MNFHDINEKLFDLGTAVLADCQICESCDHFYETRGEHGGMMEGRCSVIDNQDICIEVLRIANDAEYEQSKIHRKKKVA